MNAAITVRVPATTANLGPGFDCLGLALDLWNEADFSLEGEGLGIELQGESAGSLPTDPSNAVARGFFLFLKSRSLPPPPGLKIVCRNRIPPGSGLGSSASALLLGLLGANELYGSPASMDEILTLACEVEGHADNASAALYGGLTLSIHEEQGWLVRRYSVPPLRVVLAVPEINLPTQVARAALPAQISREATIHNMGRTALMIEALTTGNLELLSHAIHDCLHQPYRLPLIPGAVEAMAAAYQAGAAGVALSGAGPSLIAFADRHHSEIAAAMQAAFKQVGITAQALHLTTSLEGAQAQPLSSPSRSLSIGAS